MLGSERQVQLTLGHGLAQGGKGKPAPVPFAIGRCIGGGADPRRRNGQINGISRQRQGLERLDRRGRGHGGS